MNKGYKYAKKENKIPDIKSSHPGERLLAARISKQAGTVDKATIIKDKVGASNWEAFAEWMVTHGIDRFREEMEGLGGKDYIIAYTTIFEYVRPKLIRNTINTDTLRIDNISFE